MQLQTRRGFRGSNRLYTVAMPELPDIELYLFKLGQLILDQKLLKLRVFSLSLLKSVSPSVGEVEGRKVVGLRRLGKQIVLTLNGDIFVVIHLMIAGRLRWSAGAEGKPLGGKIASAVLVFSSGTLTLTEAGSKKRASLTLVEGEAALGLIDPGGIDVLSASQEEFNQSLLKESRTIKRALTDPKTLSGIGNAFSDEILHAARLSPMKLTRTLSGDDMFRLYESSRAVLTHWTNLLHERYAEKFPGPGEVTAFRPEFAVHGRYKQPCPVCGKPVQRIRFADNEANYCAECQTGGRLLADRAMSRLLKGDWPRTLEEIE
jgi:formamidopyrimidine-DNA glycosylase